MSACIRCGAAVTDTAYACTSCTAKARGWLAEIADLAPDAWEVAHGMTRRGEGGGANKPGSRPPLDFATLERLDDIQNRLVGWVRHVAAERGIEVPAAAGADPVVVAAHWLTGQLDWLRHRAEVGEALDDMATAARRVAGITSGRHPGRYAGPCSALVDDPSVPCPVDCDCHLGPHHACSEPGGCGSSGCGRRQCGQDVTARPGAKYGRCKACGAEYDVDEQQAWMRGEIEGYLARPVEIAGMLLRLGFPIGYSTIAAYVAKRQLVAHGNDEQGRPLYLIGDVINLRMGAKR